jgi:hypothetical protein
MEQTLETSTAQLLDGVTGIIKGYEARWQKTGEKYNHRHRSRIGKRGGVEGDKRIVDRPMNLSVCVTERRYCYAKSNMAMYMVGHANIHRCWRKATAGGVPSETQDK